MTYRSPIAPPKDVIALALAWAYDEVRLVGVKHALKKFNDGSDVYVYLARGLREAIRQGHLRKT